LYSTLFVTLYDCHCTDYISRTVFVPCLPMIKQVTNRLTQYCYISKRTITVIPRLTNFSANEDFFRCFSDSANEYGFG